MSKELRSLHVKEFRVAKSADGTRTLTGIVTYNSPSVDLGGFTEILAPGCFAGSLSGDVLMLRDHEPTLLMGRTKSGTLSLSDSADGLHFSCKLPNTTSATDLAESVDRGDLDATSFGFITMEDKWAASADGSVVRTVLEAELLEVSPCSFAAYPANSVSVRSCPQDIQSKLTIPDGVKPESIPETRSKVEGCQCECEQCLDGDCADCSCPDCTCEDCTCSETRSAECLRMRLKLASIL
jgi:HK97 family phage prohead protease